jgi:hypothetical protein
MMSCTRVSDVQQRDLDGGLDLVGQAVHRVGAQHEALGARALQALRVAGEQAPGLVPVTASLQRLDGREVDAPHHALRRVQAAQAVAHRLVEQAVVLA